MIKSQKQESNFDNGQHLICTHSGCGMPWSINIERPLCSFHQWGAWPTRSEHRELTIDEKANYNDKKYWAKRIMVEHNLGVKKPVEVVAMAKRALNIAESDSEVF